ncbi:MAG: YihY/virulence factor BrkB family protein, partial [Myxococcota bacterium]
MSIPDHSEFKEDDQPPRGRLASSPSALGWRGWLDTLIRVRHAVEADNLGLLAAGVAFYAFLALVPGLSATVSLWGLISTPSQIQGQISFLQSVLPADAYELIDGQLARIASKTQSDLSWRFIFSVFLALWSARKGMAALISATNVTYDEVERRGLFASVGLSLLFTGAGILMTIFMGLIILSVPAVLGFLGLGGTSEAFVAILRWPVSGLIMVVVLASLYRWGPSRTNARWAWVLPGALFATVS